MLDAGQRLMGRIDITDSIPNSEIAELAGSSDLVLDITGLTDCCRLPPRVKAQLYSDAAAVELTRLRLAATIHASKATLVFLPQLERARNIYANNALTIHAPRLRCFGYIAAYNAITVNLPEGRPAPVHRPSEPPQLLFYFVNQ
jgi:hypothetical protein